MEAGNQFAPILDLKVIYNLREGNWFENDHKPKKFIRWQGEKLYSYISLKIGFKSQKTARMNRQELTNHSLNGKFPSKTSRSHSKVAN